MKHFSQTDICSSRDGTYERIYADTSDLLNDGPGKPTQSGYGKKINTGMKIHFEGRHYRVYATCYGNAGSFWFTYRGRKIFVS